MNYRNYIWIIKCVSTASYVACTICLTFLFIESHFPEEKNDNLALLCKIILFFGVCFISVIRVLTMYSPIKSGPDWSIVFPELRKK